MKKITIKEYSELENISIATVYNRIKAGQIETEKINKKTFILYDKPKEKKPTELLKLQLELEEKEKKIETLNKRIDTLTDKILELTNSQMELLEKQLEISRNMTYLIAEKPQATIQEAKVIEPVEQEPKPQEPQKPVITRPKQEKKPIKKKKRFFNLF